MGAQDTLIKHLEDQGATVKKIKKGIMIYGPPPTLGTFTIHNTPSDHRALANDMAALRRIGLTHPLDNKPLTMEVAEGYGPHVLIPISPRINKRARQVLHSQGWPLEVTTTVLTGHMAGMTAEKALYQLGYRHDPDGRKGRNRSRIWVGGAEVARLHEEVEKNRQPEMEPDVEVKVREGAGVLDRALERHAGDVAKATREFLNEERFDKGPTPDLGLKVRDPECEHPSWERIGFLGKKCTDCGKYWEAPDDPCAVCGSTRHTEQGHPFVDDHQGEPEPDRIDFIDERDSWVVDAEELLGPAIHSMFENQLRALRAVGIEYEIRVWRKKEA